MSLKAFNVRRKEITQPYREVETSPPHVIVPTIHAPSRMHEAQRHYRILIERIRIRRSQASIIAGPKFKGAPIRCAVWLALEIPRGLNPYARNGRRYRTSVETDGWIKGMKWAGMPTSTPNIIPLP